MPDMSYLWALYFHEPIDSSLRASQLDSGFLLLTTGRALCLLLGASTWTAKAPALPHMTFLFLPLGQLFRSIPHCVRPSPFAHLCSFCW